MAHVCGEIEMGTQLISHFSGERSEPIGHLAASEASPNGEQYSWPQGVRRAQANRNCEQDLVLHAARRATRAETVSNTHDNTGRGEWKRTEKWDT